MTRTQEPTMYRIRMILFVAIPLLVGGLVAGCDRSDDGAQSGVGEPELADPVPPAAPADHAAPSTAPEGTAPPATDPQQPGSAQPAPSAAQGGHPPGAAQGGQAAGAQGHGQAPGTPAAPPAGKVTDAELDKFVAAVPKVQAVQEEYAPKINSAQSQEEAQLVQREALGEIERQLQTAGLTTAEYGMLAERIDGDPALQRRVRDRLGGEGTN
jgi:hypothetical protein